MIVLNTGWLCTYMYLILILDFFYQKKLRTAALILIIFLENKINILNHSVFQVNVSWINPVNIFLMKQCIESLDTKKKKKFACVLFFIFLFDASGFYGSYIMIQWDSGGRNISISFRGPNCYSISQKNMFY